MEVPGEEEHPKESGVPQPKNFLATSLFPANQEVADDDWSVAQLPPMEAILLWAAKKKIAKKYAKPKSAKKGGKSTHFCKEEITLFLGLMKDFFLLSK